MWLILYFIFYFVIFKLSILIWKSTKILSINFMFYFYKKSPLTTLIAFKSTYLINFIEMIYTVCNTGWCLILFIPAHFNTSKFKDLRSVVCALSICIRQCLYIINFNDGADSNLVDGNRRKKGLAKKCNDIQTKTIACSNGILLINYQLQLKLGSVSYDRSKSAVQ